MISHINQPAKVPKYGVSSSSSFSIISNKNDIHSSLENVIEKDKNKIEDVQKSLLFKPESENSERNQHNNFLNNQFLNALLLSPFHTQFGCGVPFFPNFPFLPALNNKKKTLKKPRKVTYTISKIKNIKKKFNKAKNPKVTKVQKQKCENFSNNHPSITIQDAPRHFISRPNVVGKNGPVFQETSKRTNEKLESNSSFEVEDVKYIINTPQKTNGLCTQADELAKTLMRENASNYHKDEMYSPYKSPNKPSCNKTADSHTPLHKTSLFSPYNDKSQGTLQDSFFNNRIQKLIYSNKIEGFEKSRAKSANLKKKKISFVKEERIDTPSSKVERKLESGVDSETAETKINLEKQKKVEKSTEVSQQNQTSHKIETKPTKIPSTPKFCSFRPSYIERKMMEEQHLPYIISKYFNHFPMGKFMKDNEKTAKVTISDDKMDSLTELPYHEKVDFDSRLLNNSFDHMMRENKENDFICINVAGLNKENKNYLKNKFKCFLDQCKHKPEYIDPSFFNEKYIKHHSKTYIPYNDYGRSYSLNSFDKKVLLKKHKLEKLKSESDIVSCGVVSNYSFSPPPHFQIKPEKKKQTPIMKNQHTMTSFNTTSDTSTTQQTFIECPKLKSSSKSSKGIQVESQSMNSDEEFNVDPGPKNTPYEPSYEEINETQSYPQDTSFVPKSTEACVDRCQNSISQKVLKTPGPLKQTQTQVSNRDKVPEGQASPCSEIRKKFFEKINFLSLKNQSLIKELTGNVHCYEKLVKDTFDILLTRPDFEANNSSLMTTNFLHGSQNGSHGNTNTFQQSNILNQPKEAAAKTTESIPQNAVSKPPNTELKTPNNALFNASITDPNLSIYNQTVFLFHLLTLVKGYQDQQQKFQNGKKKLEEKKKKIENEKNRQKSLKTKRRSDEMQPLYYNNSSKSLFDISESTYLTTKNFPKSIDVKDYKRRHKSPKLKNFPPYPQNPYPYPNIYRQQNNNIVPQEINNCQQIPPQNTYNPALPNNNVYSSSFYKNGHNGNQSSTLISRTSLNNSVGNMMFSQNNIEPYNQNLTNLNCGNYNNPIDKDVKGAIKSKRRRKNKKRKKFCETESESSLIEKLGRMKDERKKLKKNEKTLEMLNTFLTLKIIKGKENKRKYGRYY